MVDCMGCGGISDYNLHYNNNKMEIFSKHTLNTANTTEGKLPPSTHIFLLIG